MSRSDPRLCERLTYADFLCFKEPWGVSTALPGDTKVQFMERIGLSHVFPQHDEIYTKMEEEATQAKEVLFQEPAALMPDVCRHGQNSRPSPPYSVGEIREDAFLKAIANIYDSASQQTQNIYALVGVREDNWIIRWMLCNVINEEYQRANLVAQEYPMQRLLSGHSPPVSTDFSELCVYGTNTRCSDDRLATSPDLYSLPSPLSDNFADALLRQQTRPISRSSPGSFWDPIREG